MNDGRWNPAGVRVPRRRPAGVLSACFVLAGVLLALLSVRPAALAGAERFPRPEFQTDYQVPEQSVPPAPPGWLGYLDTAALLAGLCLAGYLALKRRSRRGIFVLMLVSLAYFGFWRGGCVCSIGSIQNMTLAFSDLSYRIPLTVAASFALPLIAALFFGRVFCAAVCPLGAIQDAVVLRPRAVPAPVARCLGMLPYVYLALAVLYAWTGAGFIVCRFDPFVGFFRLSGPRWIILCGLVLLAVGTVVGRPYCRFICPYGVLLKWMSRFSKWHVTITPDDCVQCRLCEDACPFGAIRKPAPEDPAAPDKADRKRLLVWLCMVPVLTALAAGLGWCSGDLLGRYDRRVRLADQVRWEDRAQAASTTVDSRIFHESGLTRQALFEEAAALGRRYRIGGAAAAGFTGLVFALFMCGLCLKPRGDRYEMDRGDCLSCGRCFMSCPR